MKHSLLLVVSSFGACAAAPTEAVASLLAADRAFAADVQDRGVEAWVAAFHENGAQVDEEFRPVVGHAAIRARMSEFFADPGNSLWWDPDTALVSKGGRMGSTSGTYRLTRRQADGRVELVSTGRYFDVWRRGDAGVRRLLYDAGDEDPEVAR